MEIKTLVEKRLRELRDEMDMFEIVIESKRFDYCVESLSRSLSIIGKLMSSNMRYDEKLFFKSEIERHPMFIVSRSFYE